ncbi:MAG TPA: GNAT family N-acetyltransferase [Bacteroidia bacterium]|jgi:GNAT superfamily N-acetyltransferase|nr:GNAT family N-acetyltransferase [Bacteroidia bacterium]
MSIKVIDYDPAHQPAIDKMMEGIQSEFSVAITGPTSALLNTFYNKPGYRFWVAMCNEQVVGTIGVKLFAPGMAEIKRMMVDKDFRGTEYRTASLLMETALDHAKENHCKLIYLGTMEQFIAAQKFYLRYGYVPVAEKDLPEEYVINPMDKLFYKLEMGRIK